MARPSLPPTVLALGWVSLCTDLSSEMIVPLLPAFVTGLGAGPAFLGLLEGAANAVVALLKGFAGALSDRTRRKPWLALGYGVSSLARPLLALAPNAASVLALRLVDRVGKGLRSAPRDALLAGAVEAGERGRAFGLQRAMDHAGAFGGAALAAVLLWAGSSHRTVFALAALPAALAMFVLWRFVREDGGRSEGTQVRGEPAGVAREVAGGARAAAGEQPAAGVAAAGVAEGERERTDSRGFRALLAVVALSSLATAIDLQLLLHCHRLGVDAWLAPVLWMLLHVVRAGLAGRCGALSDRVGRRRVIAFGLLANAAVLALFAIATAPWHAWVLFPLHGLHAALTEGPERGLVADLTGGRKGGRAFGAFHAASALAVLPLAWGFGALLAAEREALAFGAAAALPVAAFAVLMAAVPAAPLPPATPDGPPDGPPASR